MTERPTQIPHTAPPTDEALMQRILRRDRQAFDLLARRWSPRLVGYFLRQTRQPELAEELAQEVLISLWKTRHYQPVQSFSSWIHRIAHNRLIDEMRRKRLPLTPIDEGATELRSDEDLEDGLLARDEQEKLLSAIGTLPANQRSVLLLSKYQDLDHAQIAGVLGCSRDSVKVMLFRAVRHLTRVFKEMNHD